MKLKVKILTALAGVLLISSAVFGQITPNGSVSPSTVTYASAATFYRNGYSANGVAWTEATLWNADGTDTVLGNVYYFPSSQTIYPGSGDTSGTYWIQYRVVDPSYNYQDQWISITVNGPPRWDGLEVSYGQYTGYTVSVSADTYPGNITATAITSRDPNGMYQAGYNGYDIITSDHTSAVSAASNLPISSGTWSFKHTVVAGGATYNHTYYHTF